MTTARAAFETDGIVRVPGAVARDDVAAMRDHLCATLAAHRPPLVEVAGALRPGPGTAELLWEIGRASLFAPLAAALAGAADEVFGAGTWAPVADQVGGLAAPNFPIRDLAWNVPHIAWHVDEPTSAAHATPWGLLGFGFLDRVEPGGGATVVIAGSPRRLRTLATSSSIGLLTTDEAIAALGRDEPWFADLFRPGDPVDRQRRYLRDGHVSQGIPLRVVELTGEPGDLVLMDPRCLHTVSANRSHRPRLTMRMTCQRLV